MKLLEFPIVEPGQLDVPADWAITDRYLCLRSEAYLLIKVRIGRIAMQEHKDTPL